MDTTTLLAKEKARELGDKELLEMVEKSKGHTGKDFSEIMNCDFSYTFLTGLLQERGYVNGWHKPCIETVVETENIVETITMKKNEDTTRLQCMVDKDIANEWKEFNKGVPYKSVTISSALRRFMKDYRKGLIKFTLEL